MILQPLIGCYSPSQMVMVGSFQLGASNSVLRDGTKVASNEKMFTVTQVSTGLYEVDFIAGFPLPIHPFIFAEIEQGAPATTPCDVRVVKGTWDPTKGNRKFRLQVETTTTAPAASDGDANDRVSFLVVGGFDGPSVDPA